MSWMKNRDWSVLARAPEDGTGAAAPAADTGSVLYPDDNAFAAEGADQAEAGSPAEPAAAWEEYEPDASKSDEENAALKAEHDEARPADDNDPINQVPEDGKYNLQMPEGVEVDQAMLEGISPIFKDLWLTNGQAQALTDKFIQLQGDAARKQGEAWAETVSGWVDTARKDPEMGGAKWDGTIVAASGLISRFGTPQLRDYLNASGGGNHPEMIRFMAKVGALIGEDKPAISENPGKAVKQDSSTILYPDDQPKGK